MLSIALKKKLEDYIQACKDGLATIVSGSTDLNQAIIDNAGGIVPKYQLESHTRMSAVRFTAPLYSFFVLNNQPYGMRADGAIVNCTSNTVLDLALKNHLLKCTSPQNARVWWRASDSLSMSLNCFSEEDGFIRFYELMPSKLSTIVTDFDLNGMIGERREFSFLSVASRNGSVIETPVIGLSEKTGTMPEEIGFNVEGFFLSARSLLSRYSGVTSSSYSSLQYNPTPVVVRQIGDLDVRCNNNRIYFFENGEVKRMILLDESFFPSYSTDMPALFSNVSYNINDRPSHDAVVSPMQAFYPAPQPSNSNCVTMYSSPYVYVCHKDRMVVYYVD
jgi:hypothetical protein